jgi:hypothetical protein
MVVMSIAEPDRAQIVFSGRDFFRSQGAVWRYAAARLSGDGMEWTLASHDGLAAPSFSFKWRDAGSGSYNSVSRAQSFTPYSSRFTRLDG